MDRYRENTQIKQDNGKRRLETNLVPDIEKSPNDTYFYSVEGDRLDLLAQEYYGEVSAWVVIATANDLGRGSLSIPPGTQIRIPADPDSVIPNWSSQDKQR